MIVRIRTIGPSWAGFESVETHASIGAERAAKDAAPTTRGDAKQREVSADGEPSIAELERAMVDATLAGRLDVAGVLADRLRGRLTRAGAVVPLATKRAR